MLIDFQSGAISGTFDVVEKSLNIGSRTLKFIPKWQPCVGRLYLIFSTECNLHCVYCFQNGIDRKKVPLNEKQICKLIRSLQNDIQEIVLFGGEPLLPDNFRIIKSIFDEFDYLNILIFSNGNFDAEYRNLLLDYSYAISGLTISLDGPAKIHNRRRINPERDSYETIIENLISIKDLERKINVSINTDIANINYIESLLDSTIVGLGMSAFGYTLNPVKYTPQEVDLSEMFERFFMLKREFGNNISINNRLIYNLSSLFSYQYLMKNRCNLATMYVLSFSDNLVYACPQSTSTQIGHIADDSLILNKQKLFPLFDQVSYQTRPCLDCELNYICPFNCPFAPVGDDCQEKTKALLRYALNNIDCLLDPQILVTKSAMG